MSVIYDKIYKIVQSIPKGRVLTYGLVSHMIGGRMSAQGVGWALKALGSAKQTLRPGKSSTANRISDKPGKQNLPAYSSATVPWHRVVNAQGGTSTHKVAGIPPELQRQLLESEGIVFDDEGKMDLDKYLWMEGTLCSL
jgi:methylated-DNA-protein-cysteine methyltransferase-like protein